MKTVIAVFLLLCIPAFAKAKRNGVPSPKSLLAKAQAGDANAQLSLGGDYARGDGVPQNMPLAVYWYRKAAEQGLAPAQDTLGSLYRIGRGVPQDYAQAAAWWRKAAEQGYFDAQDMLGRAYEEGNGVPQDYAQAAVWYRKAAEQGDGLAQWSLGTLYELGQGVTQDYRAAYFWLDLAAATKIVAVNQEYVAKIRDDAASHLAPADLVRIQERARQWSEAHRNQ